MLLEPPTEALVDLVRLLCEQKNWEAFVPTVGVLGFIPGIGDAFSFWFKSNTRNYKLLQRSIDAPRRVHKGDWIFVAAVLGLLFLIVSAGLLLSFLLLQEAVRLLARL